jgi:hypothetical protein
MPVAIWVTANRSVDEMGNVRNALNAIANSVNTIDEMSHQIATAAEVQSAIAREIEQNTNRISHIADQSQVQINEADQLNHEMAEPSQKQKRFNFTLQLKPACKAVTQGINAASHIHKNIFSAYQL